jgi:hypothetical protein
VGGLARDGAVDVAPIFDAYACGWFEDQAALGRVDGHSRSAQGDAADAGLFDAAYTASMSAVVDEHVIVDGDPGPVKAVWFMRFKEAVRSDPERNRAAHARWTASHGKGYGVRVPGISRYVQNHVVTGLSARGGAAELPELCGFSECWFESLAALEQTLGSPEWAAMNADARDLFDSPWSIQGNRARVEEQVLKLPPRVTRAR